MVKDFCNYTKSKTAIHNGVYIFQGFIAYLVSSALFFKKVDRLQAEKKNISHFKRAILFR